MLDVETDSWFHFSFFHFHLLFSLHLCLNVFIIAVGKREFGVGMGRKSGIAVWTCKDFIEECSTKVTEKETMKENLKRSSYRKESGGICVIVLGEETRTSSFSCWGCFVICIFS